MHLKRVHLGRIASTNGYLSELLKRDIQRNEMVVTADYQDSGRGQGNHSWHSNPKENLLMSLLLFPAFLSASDQFHLSRLASLALCDTLKGLHLIPDIKWPNDILVKNRKIAGILIENGIRGNKLSHSILGIGLNLKQDSFPGFPVPATSVVMEGLDPLGLSGTTDFLIHALEQRYEQLESGSAGMLEREYLGHLFGLNRPGEFISDGVKFTGMIRGVSDFGELRVEKAGRIRNYSFHQIKCIVPSP